MEYTQSLATTADAIKPCESCDYTMLDGYDWMELQSRRGLWSNPAYGDWPYVVYANGKRDDVYVIKEFTEHDVKTWTYTPHEGDDKRAPDDPLLAVNQYSNHLKQLKEYWTKRQRKLDVQ